MEGVDPEKPKRLLYRSHICYLERALQAIMAEGGFGEVSIKIRDGKVFEITVLQSNRTFEETGR